MKKSRIFMAAGSLALVVVSIFATKANNKRFASYSGTVYTAKSSGSVLVSTSNSCNANFPTFTTTVVTGKAATLDGVQLYGYSGTSFKTLYY
jgi:hypothetical protein